MEIKLRVGQVYLWDERYRKIIKLGGGFVEYTWWDEDSPYDVTKTRDTVVSFTESVVKYGQLSKKHIINEFFNEIS